MIRGAPQVMALRGGGGGHSLQCLRARHEIHALFDLFRNYLERFPYDLGRGVEVGVCVAVADVAMVVGLHEEAPAYRLRIEELSALLVLLLGVGGEGDVGHRRDAREVGVRELLRICKWMDYKRVGVR